MARVVAVCMVVVGVILINVDVWWWIAALSGAIVNMSGVLILIVLARVLWSRSQRPSPRTPKDIPAHMKGGVRSNVVALFPRITTADLLWWREQAPADTLATTPTITERLPVVTGTDVPADR